METGIPPQVSLDVPEGASLARGASGRCLHSVEAASGVGGLVSDMHLESLTTRCSGGGRKRGGEEGGKGGEGRRGGGGEERRGEERRGEGRGGERH